MIIKLLHKLVAVPAIYDLAQFIAGASILQKKLRPVFQSHVPQNAKIIDIGGGTGLNLSYFQVPCDYTCLDNDPQKLEGFQAKFPDKSALLGDAMALPVDNASFDVAMMSFVSHHLPDDVLHGAFSEITRVLKPTGHFIFLDGLWEPRVLRSRFLWRVDRGANPRPYAALRAQAETYFDIHEELRCAVHHRYVCWVLKPKVAETR